MPLWNETWLDLEPPLLVQYLLRPAEPDVGIGSAYIDDLRVWVAARKENGDELRVWATNTLPNLHSSPNAYMGVFTETTDLYGEGEIQHIMDLIYDKESDQ